MTIVSIKYSQKTNHLSKGSKIFDMGKYQSILITFLNMICANNSFRYPEENITSWTNAFGNVSSAFFALHGEVSISNFNSDQRIIEAIISSIPKDMPYTILNYRKSSTLYKVETSAIIAFGSIGYLRTFNSKALLVNRYPKQFQFLVYCQEVTEEEL